MAEILSKLFSESNILSIILINLPTEYRLQFKIIIHYLLVHFTIGNDVFET